MSKIKKGKIYNFKVKKNSFGIKIIRDIYLVTIMGSSQAAIWSCLLADSADNIPSILCWT